MTKPLIGITTNTKSNINMGELTLNITYAPTELMTAIEQSGGIPWLIPVMDPHIATSYIQRLDGLILTGGQDVSPNLYGQTPHEKTDAGHLERDQFEIALINASIHHKKPLLGICRGMQLYNVALGGTLYQDHDINPQSTLTHVQKNSHTHESTHAVTFSQSSRLFNVLGPNISVNSYHHQSLDQLADALTVVGRAEDGLIEACEHHTLPHYLVQWHPEWMYAYDTASSQLFYHFIQSCSPDA